ncbi:hypothetical protein EJB05_13903, partial [Eragrostis curvula]
MVYTIVAFCSSCIGFRASMHSLHIALCYRKANKDITTICSLIRVLQKTRNFQLLMEDRKVLPNVAFLTISVFDGAHSCFGACSFDILRLCAGIRRLSFFFQTSRDREAKSTCPIDCSCDLPTNWKTEELLLNVLQDLEITGLRGTEHEVVFLKLLFSWAASLEKMRVTFHYSINQSKAKELCQKLSSFLKLETCVQFYIYQNCDMRSVHLLSLEDEGTG